METKFQTSFIPKSNLDAPAVLQHKPVNFFNFLATIVFLISLLMGGAVYGWKKVLISQMEKMKVDLQENEEQFERKTIEKFARLDSRFDNAKKLLDQHVSVATIFDILEASTLQTVRFKDFKYSYQNENSVAISMVGEAKSYNSVAYQSKVFSKDEKAFKSIVFSNLDLDPSGNVVFKFDSRIEPKLIQYRTNLNTYKVSDSGVGGQDSEDALGDSATTTTPSAQTSTSTRVLPNNQ